MSGAAPHGQLRCPLQSTHHRQLKTGTAQSDLVPPTEILNQKKAPQSSPQANNMGAFLQLGSPFQNKSSLCQVNRKLVGISSDLLSNTIFQKKKRSIYNTDHSRDNSKFFFNDTDMAQGPVMSLEGISQALRWNKVNLNFILQLYNVFSFCTLITKCHYHVRFSLEPGLLVLVFLFSLNDYITQN